MVVDDNTPKAYLGLKLHDENGRTVVRSVLSDSPGYLAGVNPGDQIVTLNGEDFGATELIPHVERNLKPGDVVRLEVMRRNRERAIEFPLGTKPSPRWRFVKVPAPTPEQEATYRSWLGKSGTEAN
jgi:predicted metalloprotease with PDZ domain